MSFNSSPHQPYPYHNTSRGVQSQRPATDVRTGYAQPTNYQQYPQQGNQQVRQQMMPNMQMQYQQQQQQQQSMQQPLQQSAHSQQSHLSGYNMQQSSSAQKPLSSTQHSSSAQQSSMTSTQVQKPIGPPSSLMLSSAYTRTTISELVQVPPELTSFAADPQFQMTLLKVKEQTGINFISLNRITENSVESVAIDAPTKESAQLARNLIETHFKLQQRLQMSESRLKKVETEYFSAQGEIASGMMVEFSIPSDLIGLIIGKKGARIKQIEQETGVTSINVNGESGRITVNGPDSTSVQRAREQLELHEESFELTVVQAEWLNSKYNGSTLADIKQVSNLMLARVNPARNTLDVVGVIAAVRSAKLMLATQLEYIDKQIEVETTERNIRERLSAVRKQYGINSYQSHTSYINKNGGGAHQQHGGRGGGSYGKEPAAAAPRGEKRDDQQSAGYSTKSGGVPLAGFGNVGSAGNRNDYAHQDLHGGHSRNSSNDSLHNLPPPPTAAPRQQAPKSQQALDGIAGGHGGSSSRTRGGDIDSIIGSGIAGGRAGTTSIEEATHLTREQFAAMAKNQHHNQGYVESAPSSQDARAPVQRERERGKNKDKERDAPEKKPKEAAPRVVKLAEDPPAPAHKAPVQANQQKAKNINITSGGKGEPTKGKDRNSNNRDAASTKEPAPKPAAATSLVVTPPPPPAERTAKPQRGKNSTAAVKPLTVPPPPPNGAAQPMLLQIIQGHQEAAAAAANAELSAPNKKGGSAANKPSVVKAKKELIKAVSIVSVTTGNTTVTPAATTTAASAKGSADKQLAGAMVGLALDDKEGGGDKEKKPSRGRNRERKTTMPKEGQSTSTAATTTPSNSAAVVSGSTVAAPVSVPGPAKTGTAASGESLTAPAPAAATAKVAPLVSEEPALPKRAKRNPGTSAVVVPAAASAAVSGDAKTAPPTTTTTTPAAAPAASNADSGASAGTSAAAST